MPFSKFSVSFCVHIEKLPEFLGACRLYVRRRGRIPRADFSVNGLFGLYYEQTYVQYAALQYIHHKFVFSMMQKCGGNTAKYATRTSMWLAEIHKARGQFREAANVLFRASMLKIEGGQGVSLRAGVLLEQAAYCYLRLSPPMLRKFGFHMVLAGNRYTVCFQVFPGSHFSFFGLTFCCFKDRRTCTIRLLSPIVLLYKQVLQFACARYCNYCINLQEHNCNYFQI